VISTLFGPLILIAYGNEDHAKVRKLALQNSQFVGIITAVMVGLLCGFSKPILGIWLGTEYMEYSHWFILKQITLPFFAAAGVFALVSKAWNKIMFPAALTLILGILNFSVAYMICIFSKGSASYILIILATASFFIIIQSFGLNTLNFIRIYPEVPKSAVLTVFLKIMITLSFSAICAYIYTLLFNIATILSLLFGFTMVLVIVVISGFFVLFNHTQRKKISSYVCDTITKRNL
jgi:membrane protein EpsK